MLIDWLRLIIVILLELRAIIYLIENIIKALNNLIQTIKDLTKH